MLADGSDDVARAGAVELLDVGRDLHDPLLLELEPERVDEVIAVCARWQVNATAIGEVTDSRHLRVLDGDEVVGDIPVVALVDDCPVYDLEPSPPTSPLYPAPPRTIEDGLSAGDTLLALLSSANLCSKRWVWEQYDHVIGGNTVQRPGGDAAVVRVEDGPKALALTTDVTPRYCEADPFEGGKQAVAEAWRNINAVGIDGVDYRLPPGLLDEAFVRDLTSMEGAEMVKKYSLVPWGAIDESDQSHKKLGESQKQKQQQ